MMASQIRIKDMRINGRTVVEAKINNQIVYKKAEPPILTFVRIQNNSRPKNEPANLGDTIWVYARINLPSNKIGKAPEMVIAGVQARVFINVNAENSTTYAGEIKVSKDMPDGNIEFKIYGYADIDGNVGETVTQTTDGSSVSIKKDITENLKNIMYNSDFRYNTDGYSSWTNAVILGTNSNKEMIVNKKDASINRCIIKCTLSESVIENHFYYIRAKFYIEDVKKCTTIVGTGGNQSMNLFANFDFGFVTQSAVFELKSNYDEIVAGIGIDENLTSNILFKELMCVDVTELINFGISQKEIRTVLDNTFFVDEG